MQENPKTSKLTKLRLKGNSTNCFIMSACWEPVVNFALLMQMQGSSGKRRFSSWALSNSLFQAIFCINQFYFAKYKHDKQTTRIHKRKSTNKKKQGSESLKTNFGPSSHTSVNLEPTAQASQQSNNVTENKLSVRDTIKADLPDEQGPASHPPSKSLPKTSK